MSDWPEIGIHPGIPAEEYHQGPGVSQTTLKRVLNSTLYHARHALLSPSDGSSATTVFDVGEATHIALLEPHRFDQRVVRGLELDRRSKANKEAHVDFAAEHAGKIILLAKEFDKVEAMAVGVLRNKKAVEILAAPGFTELSMVWEDEETGQLCRGRDDRYCRWQEMNIIADVKTHAGHCSTDSIERTIGKFGYDIQAAFYLDGMARLGAGDRRFVFIFVEKAAPHECRLFEASEDMILHGRAKYRKALKLWAEAEKSGDWPSWGNEITKAELRPYDLAPEEDFYGRD